MKKLKAGLILFLVALLAGLPLVYDQVKGRSPRRDHVLLYSHQDGKIHKIPLEEYLIGVVAAEMPAAFPEEALKAQAVAARTYICKRLAAGKIENPTHPGADICDDCRHGQAWLAREDLKARWGTLNYYSYYYKIKKAVDDTRGQVLTYRGDMIDPVYHASCGGRGTENSGDVWQTDLPYLRAVPCPYCADPEPVHTARFSLAEVDQALGTRLAAGSNSPSRNTGSHSGRSLAVVEKTAAGRPKLVTDGETLISARVVREKLGLRSADFTWKTEGDFVTFETRGYGHAVGMCQYGARGMAENGYSYQVILGHYYGGSAIEKVSQ